MQCTIPNIFQNGTGEINIIDAAQVNANFSAISTVLNGNIEKDNIKVGSKICINDVNMTISEVWTFSTNPVFNAGGIADSYLTANIPKKDAANTFTALQTFNAGIDLEKTGAKNFNLELVASLPEWVAADKGRLLFCTGDNHGYIGGSSGWIRLDYIGDYTGGAISRYADSGVVDDNNAYKFYFKTEGDTPTVKIAIKGENFPTRFYTELPYHTHIFTGINHDHGITDSGHYHTTSIGSHGHGSTQYALGNHNHYLSGTTENTSLSHTHSVSIQTSDDGAHSHSDVESGTGDTSTEPNHHHSVSGNTGGWSIPNLHHHDFDSTTYTCDQKQAVESANLGDKNSNSKTTGITVNNAQAGGTNAHAGVNGGTVSTAQKLYAKQLTVKINDTNVTADIKTATGWGDIGDGTGSHALHTAGTGELDASSWLTYSPGLHILEIIEPEAGFGSSLLVHIETS